MSFTDILNLSISASWLILALVLIRPLVKGKAIRCALWALVAIRLLCPVSIESELSLLPTRELIPRDYLVREPQNVEHSAPATLDIITNPIYDTQVSIEVAPSIDRLQTWELFCSILWLAGMGVMTIYAAYSYLSLRLRVRMAAWIGGRVWECDEIDSPFILGLLRPRIYLPSALDEETRDLVLAHERSHLSRLDHLWKPLGFGLLTVHWFNPILWLAYVLLCRDIELACDERVVKIMDKSRILAYSDALIRCTVPHRTIALCPLAFGEVGVKSRIKAILHYKKPGFWVVLTALLLSLILAVGFLTDPAVPKSNIDVFLSRTDLEILSITGECVTLELSQSQLPERALNGRKHNLSIPPVLLEYGETRLLLTEAQVVGEELLLTISFDHAPGEDGTLLLPYNPNSIDSAPTVSMGYWETADSGTVLGGTIRIQEAGTDFLRIGIRLARWQNTKELLSFQLDGLIHLEYTLVPGRLTAPVQSIQLEAAEIYQADDLPAFTAPKFQLDPDGTFRLVPNALTSYHAFGTYSLENGRLEMRTVDSRYVYVFYLDRDGQDFLYNRAESSEIQYYIDARTASLLPDGTRFTLAGLQETEPDTVMEGQVAELLNAIRYAPVHTFDPYDCIAANQEAYNQLICLGNETISYCFAQFAKGGQTDLKGSIMAIACREILGLTDDFSVDTYHNNGQDWYDAYILSTETEALWREMEELEWIYQSERQKSIETE